MVAVIKQFRLKEYFHFTLAPKHDYAWKYLYMCLAQTGIYCMFCIVQNV